MDMAVWKDYLKLLDQLGGTLDKLTEIERTKTAAVTKGDLNAVEECMKQEQVMSLSLRGTEQKREKLLAQLGLSGVPLRELGARGAAAARGPQESHMETRAVAERLRHKYEIFRSASEVARSTLECNLRAIENFQKAKDAPPLEENSLGADFRA